MSAQPENKAPDLVNLEIDGVPCKAPRGAMIIQVADEAGVTIPRFCYHKKLPIAANCRMCLVEVERAPKPLPACATPVAEGMKVHTRSPKALAAQRGVMEFLLINHPLDCPICDQGGECELQDLSMGFGRGVSRFTEKKRVVVDKNVGPLISTDLTRCIYCTRCIRFLQVIAGQKELGATGRGEHTQIGTYVERAITSEMSGNVIDVCPVGALTSKPFRYSARAWELTQHEGVAPHDSIGSNIHVHVRRGRVMRVVPRENEAINEMWISDRDRYSYQGLYSEDRLLAPMIKDRGVWREADWDEALEVVARGLRKLLETYGPAQLGTLVSPTATLEEMYLANTLVRGLGSDNIDHRLRQADFSDQDLAPVYPWLGQSIEDLERLDAALLVGSNIRHEQPIAAHRLRKAALCGARLMFVNPRDFELHFPVAEKIIADPAGMVHALAGVARALLDLTRGTPPESLKSLLASVQPGAAERAIAERLQSAGKATVLLGALAVAHPSLAALRALANVIAEASGATLGYLPEAANSAGGWIAGVLPHRAAAGRPADDAGLAARAMLEQPRRAYLLLGVEPEYDCWDAAAALEAVQGAEFVAALTPYVTDTLRDYADVLLPAALFAETSGTYVNAEGCWQSFSGAVAPPGDARPVWKVLRVLGNMLGLEGFDYLSSEQVRDELRGLAAGVNADTRSPPPAGASLPAQF
ncbi:MAG: NADH-quinone oxidoreductase subunit G, partial [Gammaproteobacteria bacterium]|nr:NADH-quinone oxidoreductase subunit G [Gammaproteobacteria bacterium]